MGKRSCMDAALAKLGYRMRTEKELVKALEELEYGPEEIADSLERLKDYGYLDDLRFAKEFLRSSRKKSWSLSRIKRALREKGVEGDTIEQAFYEALDEAELSEDGTLMDDRETALKLGSKLAGQQLGSGKPADKKFLSKLGRKLTSLGYDTGCCFYVINKIRDQFGGEEVEEEL